MVLWHWSQPVAYLLILRVSFCDLDEQQVPLLLPMHMLVSHLARGLSS